MIINQIPIVVPPEDDEFIYSYLSRLAQINGFTDLSTFIQQYVLEDIYRDSNDGGKNNLRYIVARFCKTMYFTKFYNSIDADTNIVDLYLSLSLYRCTSIVMPPHQQIAFINYIFGSKEQFYDFIPFVNAKDTELRYCPICHKEHLQEKGYTWFQRAHQLPGVSVCHKHECSLLRYNGNPRLLFNNELSSEDYCCKNITKHHIQYARFLHALNNSDFQLDFYDLRRMFHNKSLDKEALSIETYMDFLNSFSLKSTQLKYVQRVLKTGRLDLSSELMMFIVTYLMFSDIDDFKKYADDIDIPPFSRDGFNILGEYRKNISLIQHKCGCEFVGTDYGIKMGWGCPNCLSQYTPDEFANHLFKSAYPEGYSIVEPYKQGAATMIIRHDLCGRVRKNTFFDLLNAPACKCLTTENAHLVNSGVITTNNTRRTYELIKEEHNKNLETEGSDFRVVEYRGSVKPAKIYHSVCGNTFDVPHWSRFMRKKRCPYCIEASGGEAIASDNLLYVAGRGKETQNGNLIHSSITTKDAFITAMRELVGDDYELLGEYKNSGAQITLRHIVCGHTFTTTGSRFCNGQRCKCETFHTNDEDFISAFKKCTDGYYDIIKDPFHSRNYFKITDKTTGKEATLSKAQLTQELNRVTPSKIINNEHRHKFTGNSRSVKLLYPKMLYHIILKHVDSGNVFNLVDIEKDCDYPLAQLYRAMTRFEHRGIVEYTGKHKQYRILKDTLYSE